MLTQVQYYVDMITEQLGDHDPMQRNITWSVAHIQWALYLAMQDVVAAYPQMYGAPHEVTLERGTKYHNFCDICDQFIRLVAVGDQNCGEIKTIDDRINNVEIIMGKFGCKVPPPENGEYYPGSILYDKYSPCIACFEYPTPDDEDVTATILCLIYPKVDPATKDITFVPNNLLDRHGSLVVDRALGLLLKAEIESPVALTASQQHEKLFAEITNQHIKTYNYYIGDKLPNAR